MAQRADWVHRENEQRVGTLRSNKHWLISWAGLQSYYQQILKGALIVGAVMLDQKRSHAA